ncbi:hypothetical protein RhiirA4_471663 [Rhizophagus irregularis]|uniref:Uncharacterized protein n=1 Tax=Rhizophagus irregularis TaxID=588596 RepID=A0A2I1H3J9_9GLOM|nr:hypothetical protein RhiirA4_471663 [Rhizophagus irregularis]
MSTSESYFGQNAIISYIRKQKNKASYWGFLNNYHNIIVTSIFSDNTTFSDDWNELNNNWIAHFINEGKIIPGFKDKALRFRCLNFVVLFGEGWKLDLTSLIITEQLRYSTKLQTFWQEIIKKYKKEKEKENQVSAIASHSKRIIKIPVKDKNIKLINFCYNILQELDKKSRMYIIIY